MKKTLSCRRRLILGMSIEDAQSKFDSPESRVALRLAHERHNQGVYHELNLAQRLRNRLPSERKYHLVRHTKPSVKGFQAYIKSSPDDYVVKELWYEKKATLPKLAGDVGAAAAITSGQSVVDSSPNVIPSIIQEKGVGGPVPCDPLYNGYSNPSGVGAVVDNQTGPVGGVNSSDECARDDTSAAPVEGSSMSSQASVEAYIGPQLGEEMDAYSRHRTIFMAELKRVAKTLSNEAKRQLLIRRSKGAAPSARQMSVVDRLVEEVREAEEKGYTSLSSSSHLLEPLGLSLNVCTKRDKRVLEAFRSPLLCVPAEENYISISLWVAGALIENNELATEFPYYIAKHASPDLDECDVITSPNSVPRASIDVYFSLELYKLQQSIGVDGVLALRRFIGRAMIRQHDPLPTTPSIAFNMRLKQRECGGLCSGESTQIPWLHVIKAKVASISGTVLEVSSDDSPSTTVMREAIGHVWRTWGNLVKDLHVHGDLDYLYVSVRPEVDVQVGMPLLGDSTGGVLDCSKGKVLSTSTALGNSSQQLLQGQDGQDWKGQNGGSNGANLGRAISGKGGKNGSLWNGFNSRKTRATNVILPTDFVVVECLLEKRGLPHRLVVEDITESLTEMQRQAMEVQRLAVIDEAHQQSQQYVTENEEDESCDEGIAQFPVDVRPVLYAPTITVSHAGVIDSASHSFQRIRIRGSCLAHIEALAKALGSGEHFVEREGIHLYATKTSSQGTSLPQLPPNLHFSRTHADGNEHAATKRLIGHHASSSHAVMEQRAASGYFHPYQTLKPMQYMIADHDEREFWREHFYKLSDITLVFHDRVCAADINNSRQWSSTLKSQLLSIGRQRSGQMGLEDESDDTAVNGPKDEEGDSTGRARKKKPKKGRGKRAAQGDLEDVVSTMSPEKIFEYLCFDMEVTSASYDLRMGDNDGYDYRVKLRRIPQSHFPLVKPAMVSLQKHGFINYFGPQRFSSYTRYNMHPGLHLLKGEFHAAASIIVQQFYMNSDLAAEKRRNGHTIEKMYSSKGAGFRLPDIDRSFGGRRSVTENGSALQSVLSNALQASSLLGLNENSAEMESYSSSPKDQQIMNVTNGASVLDPCGEAFLRVVGPKACSMLVHEFLAFLWNDIVNQRLQRYGTFAILPGDLVRLNPLASPHSNEFGRVVYASKNSIEKGKYTCYDVVLPVPGAGVELPDNHTADLYVVTLKRMGILFNPESKQWDIFRSRSNFGNDGALHDGEAAFASSPYNRFSTSFALMEEELGGETSVMNFAHESQVGEEGDAGGMVTEGVLSDGRGLRRDLRHEGNMGNPLGVNIWCSYRHMLVNPSSQLRWRFHSGRTGDPYQRWAFGVRNTFMGRETNVSSLSGALLDKGTLGRSAEQPQQQLLLLGNGAPGRSGKDSRGGKRRARTLPAAPYWLPEKNNGCLELFFQLPSSVYPSMLLREVTKSDVNSPDVVDLDRPLIDTRAESWNGLTADQQQTYRRYLAKKRQKLFTEAPRAINIALLHQHIFRSGGMRRGLIPSMRGYDNVSK